MLCQGHSAGPGAILRSMLKASHCTQGLNTSGSGELAWQVLSSQASFPDSWPWSMLLGRLASVSME